MSYRRKIKLLLEEKGLSLSFVAQKCGVSSSALSRFLNGANLNSDALMNLLKILEVDVESVLAKRLYKDDIAPDGFEDSLVTLIKALPPIEKSTIISVMITTARSCGISEKKTVHALNYLVAYQKNIKTLTTRRR